MDTDTALESVEHLDFDPSIACENRAGSDQECPRVAGLLVRTCSGWIFGFCWECWDAWNPPKPWCKVNQRMETRSQHFTVVQVLRPRS